MSGLRCDYQGLSGQCAPGGSGDLGDRCTMQSDCLPGLFCGASQTCEPYVVAFPPFAGVTCEVDTGPFRSYFEVPRPGQPPKDFYRLPFPNDIRVSGTAPNQTLDLSDFPTPGPSPAGGVDIVKLYRDSLQASFDGFSPIGSLSLRFSKDIDFGSLMNNMLFVDLGTMGSTLGFEYSYAGGSGTKYSCPYRLVVDPYGNVPLSPGRTYAVMILDGARSATAEVPAVDPDLAAMLSGSAPTDATLTNAWNAYAPLRSYLAANAALLGGKTVVNAAVFTVGDPTKSMRALAAASEATAAPAISDVQTCGSGTLSTCDAIDAAHACGPASSTYTEIHGRITMPIFQAGTAPYLTSADGGDINLVGATPTKVRDEAVCFAMTVPKGAAASYPIVVFGHGTGGSMRDFIADGVADKLSTASTPFAVLSFDEVEHGERRGMSTSDPNNLVFNVLNPKARDNFLQGASDVITALRATSGTIAGQTFTSKVAYFGHSQGSIHGELGVPFIDVAHAVILSGAGAKLTESLLTKTSPSDYKAGLEFLVQDAIDGSHPVLTLFQTWFDRADPIHYGRLMISSPPPGSTAKNVFKSWGTMDTYTPTGTLEIDERNLAAQGLPTVTLTPADGKPSNTTTRPVQNNLAGVTGVAVQYAIGNATDGHFVAFQVSSAVQDWTSFLTSYVTMAQPQLP
jgi:hypothetical protein